MRRFGGTLVVAAAAVAAGLTAHATSAARLSKSTLDVTYSCAVQKAKAVDIYAGTAVPAYHSAGALSFDTGIERKTVNGTTTTKAQASVVPQKKNGVTVDRKNCKKTKTKVALSPKSLPVLATATPSNRGYTSMICLTASRIVFRLQVQSTGGKPTSAVFAVRNADKKGKPIAFVRWSTKKVTAHFETDCNSQ